MRKHVLPQAHANHPNVVPLIDVVMCLIIFFMLVAKIGVSTGEDKGISIPLAQLGKDARELGVESALIINVRGVPDGIDPIVTALVTSQGKRPVDGKPVQLNLAGPGGRNELAMALRLLRYGQDGKPGGTGVNADNEQFKIIIRGDQELSYRALQPILKSAQQSAVREIAFQVKPKT